MSLGKLVKPGTVIWIVAPHADDEILGCGGLISRARELQADVYVLFLTLSGYAPLSAGADSSHDQRRQELERVMQAAGARGYDVLYDNGRHHCYLDTVPIKEMLDWLEKDSPYSFTALRPQLLCLPSASHSHQDHRRAAEVVQTLLRADPFHNGVDRLILEYEIPAMGCVGVPSFEPNLFFHLTADDLAAKCELFAHYRSQIVPAPHPRSADAIRTLAAFRGLEAGCAFAEAYRLVRGSLTLD